jgi:hypothetical protein
MTPRIQPSLVAVLALAACIRPAQEHAAAAPPADACPLRWAELGGPEALALAPWPVERRPDEWCPEGFDPAALLAPGGCAEPDCTTGVMGGGRRVALAIEGPAGSGRFAALGLAVEGAPPRGSCALASTVAWRHLHRVADLLAPLPWLADVDGDGAAELIVWQRLPWGDSEMENGLVPVVYALEGDRLLRRDRRGAALAARVAAAYRKLAAVADRREPLACYRALADALERWGDAPDD